MKKKKIVNYSPSYLYDWHILMAANFQRLANQSEARGFPDSRIYFENRAESHRKKFR